MKQIHREKRIDREWQCEWGRVERPETRELQTQQSGWGWLLRLQALPGWLCVSHQGVSVAPAHKEVFPTGRWGAVVKLLARVWTCIT